MRAEVGEHMEDPPTRVVELFHRVAGSVPAYRAFLAEHGVDPVQVRTFADFERLPLLTKENYHRRYPLPDLCRQGRLAGCDMIAVSSGSTGQPTIWPRSVTDELAAAARFEQVFADSFAAGERTTLAVVCFPLGTWVGGLFTLACVRRPAGAGGRAIRRAPAADAGPVRPGQPVLRGAGRDAAVLRRQRGAAGQVPH